MLDIYKLGDEVLRSKCEKVTKFDEGLRILIDSMFETMEEADGVGLAGPQVGVEKRLFVVSIPQENVKLAFINPEIIETSSDVGPYEEGCLSIPGVYHQVIRPLSVKVFAQDIKGKSFTIDASGLLARVIQHENDHLDGKLFIDRLEDKDREKVISLYQKKNKRRK